MSYSAVMREAGRAWTEGKAGSVSPVSTTRR